jgi:hypothetical protein
VLVGVAVALIATSGGGDDDDAASGFDRDATTTTTTTTGSPTVSTEADVPVDRFAAIEDEFVADCVDDQVSAGELSEASAQGFCSCSFAGISNAMDFDTFLELNEQARSTGEQPPEIAEAVAGCVDRF